MIGAVILFTLFIFVYVIIADVFTVLFRLTGLTDEKARFQVISLLTNSGFTTQESEIIVNSKIRRRLAKATMIFGYSFTVTIVSTVVNMVFALKDTELRKIILTIPLVLLILIIFTLFRKNNFLKSKFDFAIEKIGNRLMFGKNKNPIILLDSYGSLVIAQIILHTLPNFMINTQLKNCGLKENYDILVMMIKKSDGTAEMSHGSSVIKKFDTIIVLGSFKKIKDVFEKVG